MVFQWFSQCLIFPYGFSNGFPQGSEIMCQLPVALQALMLADQTPKDAEDGSDLELDPAETTRRRGAVVSGVVVLSAGGR